MKIKRFNESEQINISNDRINEILEDLKDISVLLDDKGNSIDVYLNELDNYKSQSVKGNDQIDDSILTMQIIKKNLNDSIDKINTVVDNLFDYNQNGRKTLYLAESAIDNITDKGKLLTFLCNFVENIYDRAYVRDIYDHVQTHAVYGMTSTLKDKTIEQLRKIGAKKFRIVKNKLASDIICFDASAIKF